MYTITKKIIYLNVLSLLLFGLALGAILLFQASSMTLFLQIALPILGLALIISNGLGLYYRHKLQAAIVEIIPFGLDPYTIKFSAVSKFTNIVDSACFKFFFGWVPISEYLKLPIEVNNQVEAQGSIKAGAAALCILSSNKGNIDTIVGAAGKKPLVIRQYPSDSEVALPNGMQGNKISYYFDFIDPVLYYKQKPDNFFEKLFKLLKDRPKITSLGLGKTHTNLQYSIGMRMGNLGSLPANIKELDFTNCDSIFDSVNYLDLCEDKYKAIHVEKLVLSSRFLYVKGSDYCIENIKWYFEGILELFPNAHTFEFVDRLGNSIEHNMPEDTEIRWVFLGIKELIKKRKQHLQANKVYKKELGHHLPSDLLPIIGDCMGLPKTALKPTKKIVGGGTEEDSTEKTKNI